MIESLPTKKRPRILDLARCHILIYGEAGVGKTTWASKFPEALFLATEEGQGSVSVYHQSIRSWEDFLDTLKLLRKDRTYKTIVIDTIDILFNYCQEYVGTAAKFMHPSDLKWGKGYDMIKTEFTRGISRLTALGKGVIFISHAVDKEVTTRVLTTTKTMPSMAGQARKVIIPLVDIIIYAGIRQVRIKTGGIKKIKEKRIAIMEPSENIEAKDRTGLLPLRMPLDGTAFIETFKQAAKRE